jgi:protein gp37
MPTGIEWTDETWNPMTGCTEISAGCDHCYAHVVAERRTKAKYLAQAPVQDTDANREDPFAPRFWPERLEQPLRWQRPRKVFVNSMSDVFHAQFKREHIFAVLDVISEAPQHQFQVLTKRPERAARVLTDYMLRTDASLPPNLWLGVTVENRASRSRIDVLRTIPAAIRFLSCEPLLEDISEGLDLTGIHWVILGGESGHGCRPCDPAWLDAALMECLFSHVPVFLKQLGGFPNPRAHDRALLDGQLYKEFPHVA